MTQKETAQQLINKMMDGPMLYVTNVRNRGKAAKECALVVVDEILINDSFGMSANSNHLISDREYWEEVKNQIGVL
jgi:hypothetical protein